MAFEVIRFPQFDDKQVFISLIKNIKKSTLETIRSNLIEGNTEYDYCFLNTKHLISREFILGGIHRAMLNYASGQNKAKSLHTEIILCMSPVNNIMEALKKFGVDPSDDGDLVCVKVVDAHSDMESIHQQLLHLVGSETVENISLTDEYLWNGIEMSKFKKLFKLNDAKIESNQDNLTRLAIGTSLLRGN